jgi:hypothetical protein
VSQALEFRDIHRFAAEALRNAVIRCNSVSILFGIAHFGCVGNAIIGEQQAAS